ncbi:MAG: protein-L-isoaspartate O-methyltransferase [Candidatus Moranbacteria bacterium]|jgi:protein-L-isoaspartate(D-aspartate) O-methyltransferase|nr:protein-L-isoaspartate O-methyltransferase [Candidatus Moranbacteria bacterium]NCU31737.1 protein-L-isoaspartate O-methyltransferase [Candidatus Moranbacteria bacterium]
MSRLTNKLMRSGYLRTSSIIEAFANIERVEFVPGDIELSANADVPLPIGYGQTISQPTTMAIMLELLDPREGNKILDIGSGSGWSTALLAYIVGEKGKVIALERIKELCDFGRKNIRKMKKINKETVEIYNMDGSRGYAARAPYDRILVSASGDEIYQELKDQLKIGGKLVMPVYNRLHYLEKRGENDFYEEKYPGFMFVPLITKR